MELYKTVRAEAEATQVIEKSKFIAHIKPVETREEADVFLAEIRGRYKDATHNVPAFVIGNSFQVQWASDDGEPQGTSGAPMVQMLVKEGITNVAVVVTRYFGGIKLGTGGLVRAYTGTAKLGLEAAGICSVLETVRLKVRTEYTYLAKLQNMASERLTSAGGESPSFVIEDTEYSDAVTLTITVLPENRENVVSLMNNMTSGNLEILEEAMCLAKS